MEILLGVLVFLSIINIGFLVVIGSFIVRFRERVNGLFSDMVKAMSDFAEVPVATVEPVANRPKTWDEKYEVELDNIQRRLRADSGLSDLPAPGVSWGEPPALNNQNTQGLTIKDR